MLPLIPQKKIKEVCRDIKEKQQSRSAGALQSSLIREKELIDAILHVRILQKLENHTQLKQAGNIWFWVKKRLEYFGFCRDLFL